MASFIRCKKPLSSTVAFSAGCTLGMILAAKALLDETPNPTEDQLKHFMHGNICRCTGYKKIIESIMAAAKLMRQRRA